jgi:hypothetical protein
MNARLRLAAATTLAALLVACGSPAGSQSAAGGGPDGGGRRPANAIAAPDFSVTSFSGPDFRLSDRRGSVVVLNFFESW